jgi:dynein-related subfamily AAA family protein
MRPIPAPRLGDTHGLLRAINQRDRLRLDEFITEFSIDELFPPGLENALGRTRQFVSFARSAGLLKEDRGVVELTEIGKRYVKSGDEDSVFEVSSGQAEWLRRQLFERHMTDSIYHGAAIGLSLYASNPEEFHVSRLDFGRALAHLGRAGWDNENTLESQGERYTTFLRDLELLDDESRLTEVGTQTKSELTLPVHMSLRDLAGQLNPGGPEAAEAEGEAEWAAQGAGAAAAEPEPEPEPEPAEEPAAEADEPEAAPAIDTGEYEDVAGAQAGRAAATEQSGRPIPPSDIWETAAPDEATRAYSAISPEQAAAAAVDPSAGEAPASVPPPGAEEPAADEAPDEVAPVEEAPADEDAESVPGMTSGDPLAGMTSGDPLGQPPADVEGPGVESAAPEVAADAPAADAPVPVVEVPAELASEEAPTSDEAAADEAAAAALADGVSVPPPGAGTKDVAVDEVSAEKVEPEPATAEDEAAEQEAAAGLAAADDAALEDVAPQEAEAQEAEAQEAEAQEAEAQEAAAPDALADDAVAEDAVAEDAAAQEAAAGVAPPEDAEAREAAAVAEEAAVADAALAESAGAAPAAAALATSTREPSGFLDIAAVRSAAEGAGLKLPDSVYAGIVAALASGKHLVIAGPAGSGKTSLALAVAKAAVQAGRSEGAALSTASPKWTAQDTVGRVGESGFSQGHVLSAAGKKKWLIIDEIDRAKLDKAFGDLSSFLGGLPLSLPDGSREIAAPKDWRIVATRDSGSGTPEASAALLRRFAEIRLPRPDTADLDAAIDAATEGDPMAAAVVKRLAADDDLAGLGAGSFLDAAHHAAERNALSPASEEELEQELRAAYIEPQLREEDD